MGLKFIAKASMDGKLFLTGAEPPIEYRIGDDCPYGESATKAAKPFAHVVIHHTAPDHSTDWYVRYQIIGDKVRGGHFGYHFYIAPEGRIVQGAPLYKRTNHISGDHAVRRAFGKTASNANAIGVSCVGAGTDAGFRPTIAQVKATLTLTDKLREAFAIPQAHVYGHGEIQTNRMWSEGRSIAKLIRGALIA